MANEAGRASSAGDGLAAFKTKLDAELAASRRWRSRVRLAFAAASTLASIVALGRLWRGASLVTLGEALAFGIVAILCVESARANNFFERLAAKRRDARKSRLTSDEHAIVCLEPDDRRQEVRWDELSRVVVLTTDQGPFVDDVFWLLEGERSTCAFSNASLGVDLLLPRLCALPGFDAERLSLALLSTENARFVCWERAGQV